MRNYLKFAMIILKVSLIPSCPDLFLRVILKIWEWPGDEATKNNHHSVSLESVSAGSAVDLPAIPRSFAACHAVLPLSELSLETTESAG